jgi:peptide/nickel transport system ATP-binding protein
MTDMNATLSALPAAVHAESAPPLLALQDISMLFERRASMQSTMAWMRGRAPGPKPSPVRAVDQVSLSVGEGEIVGLVGESGCGKSTLGRVAVGLYKPTTGTRLLRGKDLAKLPSDEARVRQLKLQMVFQDPYASLNPRLRAGDIVGEAPVVHGLVSRGDRDAFVAQLLQRVGLPAEMRTRFPHQFSGGQRARIGIARALAVNPEFIVCDEAVAALDVSVQSQVLNLFLDLREDLRLSYLFISHNLAVVHHIADRVAVMYLGRVVETAPAAALFKSPQHPYTRALLAEAPTLKAEKKRFIAIEGEIPSPLNPPSGCHFHPRCPHAMPRCRESPPPLRTVAPGHAAACHLMAA